MSCMTSKVPVGWKAQNTYKFVELVLGGWDWVGGESLSIQQSKAPLAQINPNSCLLS